MSSNNQNNNKSKSNTSIYDRQQVRKTQKAFIQQTQNSLGLAYGYLQNKLKQALMQCKTPDCFMKTTKLLTQLDQTTYRLFDFLGYQLQQCIKKEVNMEGINGYKRCFMLFDSVIKYQVNNRKGLFGNSGIYQERTYLDFLQKKTPTFSQQQ